MEVPMKKFLAAVIALALFVPLSAVAQQEETYDSTGSSSGR